MRFQKLKAMMPRPTNPQVASPMGASVPKMPTMPNNMAMPQMPAPPVEHATLPSTQAMANSATPIELGDPKRLSKIGTILRMGRK